jgi:hypothetical protein
MPARAGTSEGATAIVTQPPPTRRLNWISVLFGLLAVVLFAAAIIMAWPLFTGGNQAPRPEATAGRLEAVHVTDALAGQGLAVEQNQGFIPAGAFSVPGQGVTVDGVPLFIFIFRDADTPAAELADIDAASIGPRGTPIAGTVPELLSHGNIVVALFDAPEDVRSKVEQALAGLP